MRPDDEPCGCESCQRWEANKAEVYELVRDLESKLTPGQLAMADQFEAAIRDRMRVFWADVFWTLGSG